MAEGNEVKGGVEGYDCQHSEGWHQMMMIKLGNCSLWQRKVYAEHECFGAIRFLIALGNQSMYIIYSSLACKHTRQKVGDDC